ncbi:unnamed protein product, partial [Danaus chrysippus]
AEKTFNEICISPQTNNKVGKDAFCISTDGWGKKNGEKNLNAKETGDNRGERCNQHLISQVLNSLPRD